MPVTSELPLPEYNLTHQEDPDPGSQENLGEGSVGLVLAKVTKGFIFRNNRREYT